MPDGSGSIQGALVRLSINDTELPTDQLAALTSARVDQRLNVPAACTVVITPLDYDSLSATAMDFDTFGLGGSMTLAMGFGNPVAMFSGKVAALEPIVSAGKRAMEVTGYDALFDLDFGNVAKVFYDSTDSEIAEQVIAAGGFTAETEPTEALYPYVLQNNISNYRMLLSRAARLNFELSAWEDTVSFRSSRVGDVAVASLESGANLIEFRARVRALKRGTSVTRLGWDPKAKQVITGMVNSGSPSDEMGGEQTGYEASSTFPSSAITGPSGSITDNQIAKSLAQGAYEAGLDGFIEGSGECLGTPAIMPGANVEIKGVGDRFDGPYYVTAATHTYDTRTGYRTRFEVRRTGI